jgi:hypothetical protein
MAFPGVTGQSSAALQVPPGAPQVQPSWAHASAWWVSAHVAVTTPEQRESEQPSCAMVQMPTVRSAQATGTPVHAVTSQPWPHDPRRVMSHAAGRGVQPSTTVHPAATHAWRVGAPLHAEPVVPVQVKEETHCSGLHVGPWHAVAGRPHVAAQP